MTPSSTPSLQEAASRLETISDKERSKFFRNNPARDLPSFDYEELTVGKLLGRGNFCNVREIVAVRLRLPHCKTNGASTRSSVEAVQSSRASETTSSTDVSNSCNINLADDDDFSDDGEEDILQKIQDTRAFVEEHCIRDGDARYAFKTLRSDHSTRDEAHCHKGIIDIANEAKFLAATNHPNIVKMRGSGGEYLTTKFFLVLDRLYSTLDEKIDNEWSAQQKLYRGCMGCIGRNNVGLAELLMNQLTVAYDLSAAFRYLHRHNVIYRDIKGENIGFDVRGDVKVFDFGLCKELMPEDRDKNGLYKLTGLTGARRFMAPEVALNKPYNLTADSYSFGLLLWQIFSLRTPFESFDIRDHMDKVVKGGYRPPLDPFMATSVREIIRECWSSKISVRPDFERISSILRSALKDADHDLSDSIANRTSHMLNRSLRSVGGGGNEKTAES